MNAHSRPIADQARARRRELGLTQTDLAELAGCSPRFLRALEGGKASVRFDKLLGVLDALGLTCSVEVRRPR